MSVLSQTIEENLFWVERFSFHLYLLKQSDYSFIYKFALNILVKPTTNSAFDDDNIQQGFYFSD